MNKLSSRYNVYQRDNGNIPFACLDVVLKECPFCGSYDVGVFEDMDNDTYNVTCHDCGGSGPAKQSKEDAEQFWNQRNDEDY